MKPRTVLLLLVAVMLGLGAAWAAARILGNQRPPETVSIVVASQDIDQGTYISDPTKYFKEQTFLKGTEPKSAITSIDDVKGRIINKSLPEDQFVAEGDLLPKDKQLVIPTADGKPLEKANRMLAVAVQVTPDAVAGGFVLPGSHVDVTYLEPIPNKEKFIQRSILFDVIVLAVDNLSELPEGQSSARNPNTVTLALTPDQAERIVLAKERGKIRFKLLPKSQYGKAAAEERRKRAIAFGDLGPDQGDDQDATVGVWVASKDIKAGTKVADAKFVQRQYLESEKPSRAISDLSKYKSQVLKHALAANKFLTEYDLDPPPVEVKQVPKPDGHVLEIHNGGLDTKMIYPKGGDYGVILGDDGLPIDSLPQITRPSAEAAPAPAANGDAAEWKKYTSKEGRFSILMPGEVLPLNTSDFDPKSGAQIEMHVFRASRPDVGECVVTYMDLPDNVVREGPIQLLNDRAQSLAEGIPGSKLLDGAPKPIQLGHYEGRELHLQLSDGKIDCRRLYLVKNRLYQVAVTGAKVDPTSKDVTKYFKSFTVE
jgi:pilus assembly protein CpaB